MRILAGDYLGLTEPRALRKLLQLLISKEQAQRCEIKIFETGGSSFHPKAYLFVTKDRQTHEVSDGFAYIGSSNLSQLALQEGVEWNIRVDLQENPSRFIHLLDAYQQLFESKRSRQLTSRWIDGYQERVKKSWIQSPEAASGLDSEQDIEPYPHQIEALEALKKARNEGVERGVIIMATGLGKTYLAAFDALQVTSKTRPKILFVAHRREILHQAETAFLDVYPEAKTGYYMGQRRQKNADILFASVQTLGQKEHLQKFRPDHFEYIVIDEFHHAAARSYRSLLSHFKPLFLLGLTATPHRTDGADIFGLCDNNILYRLNLMDGITLKKLAPFVYHGIHDLHVNYQRVQWRQGQFAKKALQTAVATKERAEYVFEHWQKRAQKRTLAFCVSKKHAEYMATFFQDKGVRCTAIHSTSATTRQDGIDGLETGYFQVLFTVDLFNEGVDIPLIDTILMLRPTESKILFLQQLGRGLRKTKHLPEKQLQVLDFIGNHHVFLNRPQALLGIENNAQSVRDFIMAYQSHQLKLPAGCDIRYDLEVIDWLSAWANATASEQIQDTYDRLKRTLGSPPTALEMFQAGQDLKKIRKGWGSWFEFVNVNQDLDAAEQLCLKLFKAFFKNIEKQILSKSYKMVTLQALIELNGFEEPQTLANIAGQAFHILTRRPKLRGDLMGVKAIEGIEKHRDFSKIPTALQRKWINYWRKNPIKALTGEWTRQNILFKLEEDQLLFKQEVTKVDYAAFHNMLQSLIDYHLFRYTPKVELPPVMLDSPLPDFAENPLKAYLHQEVMREDIPPLFGQTMNVGIWNKGYVYLKAQSAHVLLVNLEKRGLSLAHQYHDAFSSDRIFHWQSQNRMSPTETSGQRLVAHIERREPVHLFVRKTRKIKGKGAPFTYCGQVQLKEYHGEKPMNMCFELASPAPAQFI